MSVHVHVFLIGFGGSGFGFSGWSLSVPYSHKQAWQMLVAPLLFASLSLGATGGWV